MWCYRSIPNEEHFGFRPLLASSGRQRRRSTAGSSGGRPFQRTFMIRLLCSFQVITLMRILIVLLALLALGGSARAQEEKGKGLQLKDLPATVQESVQANLKGGEIRNIVKEKEDGVEQFEVESVLNGKARDFNVDSRGSMAD